MATIKEIAKLSKVSASTVSRVINNDKSISVTDETRRRILHYTKELGYKTIQERRAINRVAESKKNLTIGIVLCQSVEEEMNDPYFSTIRQGVEEELGRRGVKMIRIIHIHNVTANEFLSELEGLIVIGALGEAALQRISSRIKNVVYINYCPNEALYDSVVIDFEAATKQAVHHLFTLGFEKIGYIGGIEREHFNHHKKIIEDKRLTTYENMMKKNGTFVQNAIFVGEYTMTSGYELMKRAISTKSCPKAFFIASDQMAIGALRALQEAKLTVPNDIAIVSFDDVEMAKYASTPLTTIKIHTKFMGETGVNLLMNRMEGRNIPLKVTVPTELVVRESCGASKITC